MNKEIEDIFKDFEVDKVKIPISFISYKGKKETYLVYSSTGEDPALAKDDDITDSLYHYDIDIYTKGDYLGILSSIKEKMKENEWMWEGDGPDMFETDTGFFHKTTSFSKERSVI